MVSLLARLPRPGWADPSAGRSVPLGWLAIAAALAVSTVGLSGLGLAVVVVQTLDPSGGLPLAGSAVVAAQLWLLAHGASLELTAGPIVLAPLLLTLGIAWGLSRAGRWLARASEGGDGPPVARAASVLGVVHVAVTVLLAVGLDASDARIGVVRAAVGSAVLAVSAVGWGVGRESGVLDVVLERLPGPARPLAYGVLAGMLAALALCTAVVALGLASDTEGYAALSGSLGGAAAGALGLLGLGLLLLPNASAAALGLAAGPGFAVGSGTLVSVHGVTLSPVPALPLLAALPDTQAVPLIAFVSQAVPAVAGLVAGTTLARRFTDTDGGSVVAGLTGLLAGLGLGLASAAVVFVAGGSLGDGGLAEVGAPPLATGIAIALQSGIAAALAATVTRWRSRD